MAAKTLQTAAVVSIMLLAFGIAYYAGRHMARESFIISAQDSALGGAGSVAEQNFRAYGHSVRNLDMRRWRTFAAGKAIFDHHWALRMLAPYYNARSCSACHIHDGAGGAPGLDSSVVAELIGPGVTVASIYRHAEAGAPPVGTWSFRWESNSDGLVRPDVRFCLAGTASSCGEAVSLRIAPPLIGLGLLNAVPDSEILAIALLEAENNPATAGLARRVWSPRDQRLEAGRFGWKSSSATLDDQISSSLYKEMSLTSGLSKLGPVASGCSPKVQDSLFDALSLYCHLLAVPDRRNLGNPLAARGAVVFRQVGCAGCHRETLVTGADKAFPELSYQVIHPYTDLLLHNLGKGLSDSLSDGEAPAAAWRTAPLWGIGLRETVNPNARFLHDGRARNLDDAIRWHAGQARAARRNYELLSKEDKECLLEFLRSL